MKKILTFLVAASAAFMFTGCKSLLDTFANSPIFGIPEVMYDGQEYKIIKMSACKYSWQVNSDAISIAVDKDQKAIATAKLKVDKKSVKVTITATNPDKATEAPVKKEVTVQPWELRIFDKYKDGKEVAANELKANSTYYIKMFSVGKEILEIPGGIKTEEFNKIQWSNSTNGVTLSRAFEEGKTDYTVACKLETGSAATGSIIAKLGKCSKTINLTIK